MSNSRMFEALTARGYAVIAPDALPRRQDGPRSWTFFPGWEGRDEIAFLADVMADAADRFQVAPTQSVLAGFSAGAFMTYYLACAEPRMFKAYAPVSGGFWRPQPDGCAGPARIYQTHGWADEVVPLEGRWLGGRRFQQGDIWAGLQLWRDTNGCDSNAPDRIWAEDDRLHRSWDCGDGADIEFVLFPGGHRVPAGWANRMLDWLEAGR